MAFTDTKIKSIKAGENRKIVWEDGETCLGVRVSPSGKKSFVYMYRFNDKSRMMTLGKYPQVTLADARIKLAEAKSKVGKKEIDPGQKAIEARARDRASLTVKELVEEYLERWAKQHKSPGSYKEDKRMLYKDVIPILGRRKAHDITRRDIIEMLDKMTERGCTITANRTLAVTRKMFNFAVGRSILDNSPCHLIPAPAKENRRDRTLSAEEIRAFWQGLKRSNIGNTIRLVLKLMLVTAQRKGEVAKMEWQDIDLDSGWWTIPPEKTKNKMAHRVPLSGMAIELIAEAKASLRESRWVFPSAYISRENHLTEPAIDYAIRRNKDVFQIPHFTPHDLRRTAASMMTGAGISRLTVSKILNHVESGITAVYDRHSYDNEKRQALDAWARKLESILTGQTAQVIPLTRKL